MMGRSHVITGACALEHLYLAGELAKRSDNAYLTQVQSAAASYLGLTAMYVSEPKTALPLILYLAAFFLGVLLPDIDNPKSALGKFVRLPVKHRTWLHAIYPYIPFAVLGGFYPAFGWLFFGCVVHLFWDSFSAMGNCWFYKLLSDYREYPGGAKVKKGHYLKLYYAGEWSEYMLVFIIVALTIASYIWLKRV